MNSAALPYHTFQYALARHIRDPLAHPKPEGVPDRRMAIYNELFFNNVCGFLDRCFPVCQSIMDQNTWRAWCRRFFAEWPSKTPWFRHIPREFVRYLQNLPPEQLPHPWFAELAEYEWAELAVDVMPAMPPTNVSTLEQNWVEGIVVLNPALMLLCYAWPVHQISASHLPTQPKTTCLLVHRDAHDRIRFTHSNPMTLTLLQLLSEAPCTGRAACQALAKAANQTFDALWPHAATLFSQLKQQGILYGTRPATVSSL